LNQKDYSMLRQNGRTIRAVAAALVLSFGLVGYAAATRATTASPTTTPTATPTAHSVTFINNCNQPVWIAASGNTDIAAPVTAISSWELAPRCGSGYTCPSGSTCQDGACSCTQLNQSDPLCAGGLCLPTGVCANSVEDDAIPLTFSGRFWGRTGCNPSAQSCVTGDCGAADCTGAGANNATLWEETLFGTNTNFPGTPDNYDVSLVSGYNIPLDVQAEIPTDAPGWNAGATYVNGSQMGTTQSVIAAPSGSYTWLFNDVGPSPSATSGATMPNFSTTLRGTVDDPNVAGAGIVWSTTSSVCQTGSCTSDLLQACPSLLRVDNSAQSCTANNPSDPNCAGGPCDSNGTCIVACTVPVNYCAGLGADSSICTTQNNSFYACLNLVSTEKDPFGNPINLESANSGNAICFSSSDCQPGTTCLMTPTFTPASNVTWPAGAGICIPGNGVVTQNGGCTSSAMDGQLCPSSNYTYPFPAYTCATLTNAGPGGASASTCIPPIIPSATGAAAFGTLVWNADNFTPVSPAVSCTADSGCTTGQYCLETAVRQAKNGSTILAQAVNECSGASDTCVCNQVNFCTSSAGCTGGTQCLTTAGKACPGSGSCICQTAGIYTGVCGPTNVNWTAAINLFQGSSANYLTTFKNACPSAYTFQFDDQASDWSCYSTADQVVSYNVTFCGIGGKGM
jgi:Thaumatin family